MTLLYICIGLFILFVAFIVGAIRQFDRKARQKDRNDGFGRSIKQADEREEDK